MAGQASFIALLRAVEAEATAAAAAMAAELRIMETCDCGTLRRLRAAVAAEAVAVGEVGQVRKGGAARMCTLPLDQLQLRSP
jgi:hypothetical protein